MKKSEASYPSTEYLMKYQARAWEDGSDIPPQELEHRKNLNEQLREVKESKKEKKPKTTIAATFSKAFEERDRTR